jgi:hypothetical protein
MIAFNQEITNYGYTINTKVLFPGAVDFYTAMLCS